MLVRNRTHLGIQVSHFSIGRRCHVRTFRSFAASTATIKRSSNIGSSTSNTSYNVGSISRLLGFHLHLLPLNRTLILLILLLDSILTRFVCSYNLRGRISKSLVVRLLHRSSRIFRTAHYGLSALSCSVSVLNLFLHLGEQAHKTFSEVVGQQHITDTLQRQVADGQVGHAYLFTGTRGTGKTTCARILAKAVNCEHPVDGAPCNQCAACRGIDDGSLLDVTELDAASNGSVNDARSLREEAIYPPSMLKKRVYIIDEVHMLSKDAFNALLKIMEEPPAHLLFILATTELQKVPATILSRCQRFSFKRILPHDMEQQLLRVAQAEAIDLTSDGAELLARMANGALRDALSLLDQCRAAGTTVDARAVLDTLGLAGSTQTLQLMRLLLARESGDALALLDQLYRGGKDVTALLGELSDLCRDMTVMKAAPEGGAALLSGVYDRKSLSDMTADVPMRRLLFMTDTIQRTAAALPDSIRQRTDAELCLLRLCDESLCGDPSALEGRVSALEDAVRSGAAPARRPAAAPAPAQEERPAPVREERRPEPEEAPATTAPAPSAPAAPTGGDTTVWSALLDHYKAPLPPHFRAMLNMVRGEVQDGVLTVLCSNDFAKSQLDTPQVVKVLQEVTSRHLGQDIRVQFQMGGAAVKKAAPRAAAPRPAPRPAPAPEDDYERPPLPEEAPPAPADTPPWEEPPAAGRDKLDELAQNGRQLDNFQIK